MNFLEARNVLANFSGGASFRCLLAMSGTPDQLALYIRALAAQRGINVLPRLLPFGTLQQLTMSQPEAGETEVFLLFPWDFVAEWDWRTGVPDSVPEEDQLVARAGAIASRLKTRPNARFVYVAASVPPLFANPARNDALRVRVEGLVVDLGAKFIGSHVFSLGSYLATGSPVGGKHLPVIAKVLDERIFGRDEGPGKVLVTDLDNVLWAGGVAEDGPEGIAFAPEGVGFRHYLYQTMLKRLTKEGVLIAAVSRNDAEVVKPALAPGRMVLSEADFVTVVASYEAKSAQIRGLADGLSLGLDAFVFVDDNPVELAEVERALPQVACLPFPESDDGLPEFFDRLEHLFAKKTITVEDRERLEMYRRRLEGTPPSAASGADLTDFLTGLKMRLVIRDRSRGERTRAVQLINKTNQFNLDGERFTDEQVDAILKSGGRLFTGTLFDRTGGHGESVVLLVDGDGRVRAFVMSCRIFQRRVEYAFVAWLCRTLDRPLVLPFRETARNEPFRRFIEDGAIGRLADGTCRIDPEVFIAAHQDDLALFAIEIE